MQGRAVPQGSMTVYRGRLVPVRAGLLKAWRRRLCEAAVAARPDDWDSSLPKTVTVEFCFARPKSHLTTKGALRKGIPLDMVAYPDLDKLARAVGDALTDACAINDDRQIIRWVLEKMYCPEDFVHVAVRDWS